MQILIVYYSRTGHTREMAESIAQGVKAEKVEVEVRDVKEVKPEDLLKYKGIIIGSPVYYGNMSSEIKKLLDDSVQFHGELEGKVGGAFSSAANIGGGNETTILAILEALLIHGMIIQGVPKGDHYGPVSIGRPDERAKRQCHDYGQRLAQLLKKLV